MEDLIKALTLLLKYGNCDYPTACEHDTLYIVGIDPKDVSDEDKEILSDLGFSYNSEGFYSYKYGSA